jgi:hypothetical protein
MPLEFAGGFGVRNDSGRIRSFGNHDLVANHHGFGKRSVEVISRIAGLGANRLVGRDYNLCARINNDRLRCEYMG